MFTAILLSNLAVMELQHTHIIKAPIVLRTIMEREPYFAPTNLLIRPRHLSRSIHSPESKASGCDNLRTYFMADWSRNDKAIHIAIQHTPICLVWPAYIWWLWFIDSHPLYTTWWGGHERGFHLNITSANNLDSLIHICWPVYIYFLWERGDVPRKLRKQYRISSFRWYS